jgi:predicted small lipoprotein YifL
MKQILLMIAVVALVGCGKKEPVQPSATNPEATKPEKETGKEATQPTPPDTKATKPEPTKAKATAGVKLWEFKTGYVVSSSPAIGSDGTVYVGSGFGHNKLYAINGQSGVKLWEFKTGDDVHSSPAIGSDGTVYVGSDDKKLYAIKTDSKGLAKSPWPMRGQNARHTGRALSK